MSRPTGAALAGALVLAALPLRGQDLVPNGHFHTDLSGWTHSGAPFATQAWSSEDWQSAAGSGSILLATDSPLAPWVSRSSTPCLPLASSGAYELSGEIRVPPGQTGTGTAYVDVFWYADATCVSQMGGGNAPVLPIVPTAGWVTTFEGGVAIPTGALSAQVSLNVGKNVTTGQVSAHFDRVRFGPLGTTPAALTTFRVE